MKSPLSALPRLVAACSLLSSKIVPSSSASHVASLVRGPWSAHSRHRPKTRSAAKSKTSSLPSEPAIGKIPSSMLSLTACISSAVVGGVVGKGSSSVGGFVGGGVGLGRARLGVRPRTGREDWAVLARRLVVLQVGWDFEAWPPKPVSWAAVVADWGPVSERGVLAEQLVESGVVLQVPPRSRSRLHPG